MNRFATLAILLLGLTLESVSARAMKLWSDEELTQEADLVVLIEPLSTKPSPPEKSGRDLNLGFGPDTIVETFSTTAKVLAVEKGDKPGETLQIYHYHLLDRNHHEIDERCFPSGPDLVHFQIGAYCYSLSLKNSLEDSQSVAKTENGASTHLRYLAFLKKRPNGVYGPVSDDFDSALSFFLLMPMPRAQH